MRTTRNMTGFLFGLIFAAVIFLAMLPHKAHSADLPSDAPLPAARPVSALFTVCDKPNEAGNKVVVFVILGYTNGDAMGFDHTHLHGLSAADAFKYISEAKSKSTRTIKCPSQGVIT